MKNNQRAQSPRYLHPKSKASTAITALRAKSTPANQNRPIGRNSVNYSNPKNLISRQPRPEIDSPLDFYLSEIQSRRFITAQVRNELLDQIKSLKSIGTKYLTAHKKSKVIAKQFWSNWDGFRICFSQELKSQLISSQDIIKKRLIKLNDTVKKVNIEKVINEAAELFLQANNYFSKEEEEEEDNFSTLYGRFKNFQSFVSSDDVTVRLPNIKYQITSILSQILSQMKSIKDIEQCLEILLEHFEEDAAILSELIPHDINPQNKNEDKAISPPQSVEKSNNNMNVKSIKISSNKEKPKNRVPEKIKNFNFESDENDDDSDEIDKSNNVKEKTKAKINYVEEVDEEEEEVAEKIENNKLRIQLEAAQKLKKTKLANLNDKRKKEDEEIKNLKSKISKLNQKSKSLSVQNLERNTHSCSSMNNPLLTLRSQIRELEKEQIRLNSSNDHLLNELKGSTSSDDYEKNTNLRKKQAELNKQLFKYQVSCLRLNKIIQKATSRTFEIKGDENNIKKEYSSILNNNVEINDQYKNLEKELNDLMDQHNKLLYEKCLTERKKKKTMNNEINNINSSISDNSRNNEELQMQLDKVKGLYREKKQLLLEQQQKTQSDSMLRLQRKTETAVFLLRSDTKNDIDDLRSQLEEVEEQYKYLTDQYNAASQCDEKFVKLVDKTMPIEEVELEIRNLLQKFKDLNDRIDESNEGEIRGEIDLIKGEITEVNNGNLKLIEWISEIKKKTVEMQSKLQSLTTQYQIIENKSKDPSFDVDSAFDEAISNAEGQNSVLQSLLDNALSDLKSLNFECPF